MSYLRLAAAAVLAGSVLSACSLGDDGPDSDAIARAYETGDFSDIVLSGTSPGQAGEEYERILAGMGDREPKVSASDAAVAEETASVEMTWDWPIDGETWSYETEISLTRSDDEWEVTWEPSNIHSDLGESPDRLDAQRILAKRGKVVGSDGPLMEERPIVTYGIDKARVNGTAAAVRSGKLLARKLDIDAGDFAEQISKAGSSAFVEAVTYRKSDAPVSPGEVSNIIGVVELQGTRMLAPSKEFAAPVLGKVGPVTAEILEEHPDAYEVGDEAGVTGLQARYDEQMRGAPGMSRRHPWRGRYGRRNGGFPDRADRGQVSGSHAEPAPAEPGRAIPEEDQAGQRAGGPASERRRDPGGRERRGQ